VAEQRYQAVLAVISDGLSVSQVAEKVGGSRQTLHSWLARYPPMPGTQAVPCDIAPGASARFFAELHHAYTVASVAEVNTGKPQRVNVRVESGGPYLRNRAYSAGKRHSRRTPGT
jgi:transposase